MANSKKRIQFDLSERDVSLLKKLEVELGFRTTRETVVYALRQIATISEIAKERGQVNIRIINSTLIIESNNQVTQKHKP
jgi:hypothetical protein